MTMISSISDAGTGVNKPAAKARDPWQFSNMLLLIDQNASAIFTFTTSSKGGIDAIGNLCKSYGREVLMRPGEYPVVALGSGSYQHPNRSYGRIKTPSFAIVGWVDKGPADEIVAMESQRGNDRGSAPKQVEAPKAKQAELPIEASPKRARFSDEIPF
jgi:hypothetical protein